MKKTSLLKEYILANPILVMPGVHDALTAIIAGQAGAKAVTLGGYAASAALLGKPDVSLLSLTEMADCVRRVADAVDIPLFTDGDTGYGGVLNVQRTVKELEKAGAAGMFIEDQVFPKRCGHMEGKEVIPPGEMVAKIKAGLDAREDPDFVFMARTDALAVNGIEEAIDRANMYHEAGADLVFIEAPRTIDEMRTITSSVMAPCLANNIEGGKSPVLSAGELEKIGYAVVVFPVSATYAIAKIIREVMGEILTSGTSKGVWDRMVDFEEFSKIVDLAGLRDLESSYAPTSAQTGVKKQ